MHGRLQNASRQVCVNMLLGVSGGRSTFMYVCLLAERYMLRVQVRIIKLFGALLHLFKKDLEKVPKVVIDGSMMLAVVL